MTQNSSSTTQKNADSELISKTQLKNEAKALQAFGKQLIELSIPKLEQLPLSETTKNAVKDFHKQSGHIARKRHLAFIGKCLRNDDAKTAQKILAENDFASKRERVSGLQSQKNELARLADIDDSKIEDLLRLNDKLERQQLRQLVRNVNNAKNETKKSQVLSKLHQYLLDNNAI